MIIPWYKVPLFLVVCVGIWIANKVEAILK